MNKTLVIPLIGALVFVADFLSKQWALSNLADYQVHAFIPGVLQLVLTTNTGAAFGIGQHSGIMMMILPTLICLVIIGWIVNRSRRGAPLSLWECIGYGLVLGGAFGNIAERVYRGHVTDFLDFAFMQFPVFNVADSLIDVGVGVIILHSLFSKSSDSPAPNDSSGAEKASNADAGIQE